MPPLLFFFTAVLTVFSPGIFSRMHFKLYLLQDGYWPSLACFYDRL